ncbi:transmembrane protein, putative (macronuclear) [Tetrahymena thermophila SB210]|uniref:Transmembrane protein, putative n=1 Tax=Tetrahymena thermophila (strain SB210) TaxID=312017 RepID=I7M8J1_TETTS|nr:transmembrane protein, putative [Tetrahymena thermophila SB210]EAR98275.2 transmembrane protein, putative [Tetrahymena thermophila SB210]|eukprot:XP_001018520.2 transmembrane protein, putative [Tetrahymena thermophila SB210]
MMLVGCSKDGQLIAWDISNVFQDQYLYSVQLSQDPCIELIQFNVTNPSDIIAVFNKTIFLIDVISLNIKYQWQQQNLKMKYSVNNNSLAILIDSNFTYFIQNYKNQIYLNFNGPINDIQNITFQQAKYLIVQRNNSIDLYQLAINQLNKISSYLLSSKLLFFKIRDISQNTLKIPTSFEISLFTADQQFVLMGQNFVPYQTIKGIPLSTIQDIQFINSDPNDPLYFMIGKNNKTISTYPFSLYSVQRNFQQITLISEYTYASQFIPPTKYYDSYNNSIYDLKVLSNKGSMSTLTTNSYDPKRNRILLEQQQNILGKTGIKFTVSQNMKILYGKNYQGTINVGNFKIQQYKLAFNISHTEQLQGITIINLQHSYTMSKYFIITNNIFVFNIHTREYIETIQIDNTSNPIKQFQPTKQFNQIVATKQNILFTKNYDTNSTYQVLSTQPFSQFTISEDKYNPSIIIAADQITKFNLNLTVNRTLQYPTNSFVKNIFFATSTKVIFQFQNSQIFVIDYFTFTVTQQIQPIHIKNNYQLQYDSNLNYIYIFSTYKVEIFSIYGTLINAILPIGQAINQIQICSNYTLLVTSNNIDVFSVQDFSYLDSYNFLGGNIQKILFIQDFNHIVVFGDTIKNGQIFVYSLLNLEQIQIFTNPYSYNNPSLVIDMFYDNYASILTYLDQNGNIYSLDYSGAYEIVNLMIIKEFLYDGTIPLAMQLIKQKNELFIFNQTSVFSVNYGSFTEKQIVYSITQNNIFIRSQVQLYGSPDQDIFIMLGQQNVLYQYSNFKSSFFYYLQDNQLIKDISLLSSDQILLMLTTNYYILQVDLSIDNLIDSVVSYQSYNLNDLQFSYFLCTGVFYSLTQQIIQYDFFQQQIIQQIPLLYNQIILSSYSVQSLNLLVIGLNDGTIIFLNTAKQNYQTIQPFSNQIQKLIRYISETVNYLWIATTSAQVLQIQKSNLNQYLVLDYSSYASVQGNKLTVFLIDDLYQRMYLSFQQEKKIVCFDIKQITNYQYTILSFPNNQLNTITLSSTQIIFYSTSQLNIFNRKTLKYIGSIRRQGMYDSIQTVQVFQDQFYLVLSQGKFELIQVDQKGQKQTLIDQVIVDSLNIMMVKLDETKNILRVVGTSQYQIIDQSYNLNIYLYSQLDQTNQICGLDIIGLNYLQMTQQVKLMRSDYTQKPSLLGIVPSVTQFKQRQINYYLKKQDLSDLNINITQESDIIISPYSDSSVLGLMQDFILPNKELENYSKNNLYMKNFNFIIKSPNSTISFNQNIQQVYLQNVKIQNQSLFNNQILFQNLYTLVIKVLEIQNITLNIKSSEEPFFSFINCKYIYIEQLFIKNITIISNTNSLIKINQSQQIVIKNLTIIKSQVQSSIIKINDVFELTVETILIQNMMMINPILPSLQNFSVIFSISAVSVQKFINVNMLNNQDITFIESSSVLQVEQIFIRLQQVQFSVANSQFTGNKINRDNGISLINVNAAIILLENLNFYDNECNILLQQTQIINIVSSQFFQNINENGGALSVNQNSKSISVQNSTFYSNVAYANGGAIFLQEVYGDVFFDKQSQIFKNQALIGGGVRIYNSIQNNNLFQLSHSLKFQTNINNNNAKIYGQDIATIISKFSIVKIKENNKKIDFQFLRQFELDKQLQDKYSGKLLINNINSGSFISITINLENEFGESISFNQNELINQKYPQIIISELQEIQLKIVNQDNINTLISGVTQLGYQNYNQNNKSYTFDNIQIVSSPNGSSKLNMFYNTFLSYKFNPILIDINYRSCKKGEIVQQQNQNIYRCFECPNNYYSLKDQKKEIQDQLVDQKCIPCPDEAKFCQADIIQLKEGYWRSDFENDDILYCSDKPPNCVHNYQTKQSCLEGMVGPLCVSCDSFGEVWGGEHYTISYFNNYECVKCNKLYVPFILISILVSIILLYSLWTMIIFLNSFTHYQICFYLRKLDLLPVSKSCFRDQSSFYLKILINYLQLTSYIIETRKLFPNQVNTSLFILQSPTFYFISIIDCLINSLVRNRISRTNLISFLLGIFPFFCMIIVSLVVKLLFKLKLINVQRTYQRTLFNLMIVLFQPSQITYFTNAVGCIELGKYQYSKIDYLIQCNNPTYMQFAIPYSISILSFWICIPLIILYQLRLKRNILDYCKTKFQYGYFYSEYNKKFYYWEFIRMYIRIAIVFIFTLIDFVSFYSLLVVVVLLIYIKMALKFNPIVNKDLQKTEIVSILVIIVLIITTKLNMQYNIFALSILTYLIFCSFVFSCLYMIFDEKLHSEFNIFGRVLKWIIERICSKSFYLKFIKKKRVQFSTYQRWKILKKKIKIHLILKKSYKKQNNKLLKVKPIIIAQNTNKEIENDFYNESPDSLISQNKFGVKQLNTQLCKKLQPKTLIFKDSLPPIVETIDSTEGDTKTNNCQIPYVASTIIFSDKRNHKESKSIFSENNSVENFNFEKR